ncbi:MAG: hypothetical protein QM756_23250 [Polyangiaceae bacterium]
MRRLWLTSALFVACGLNPHPDLPDGVNGAGSGGRTDSAAGAANSTGGGAVVGVGSGGASSTPPQGGSADEGGAPTGTAGASGEAGSSP